MVTILTDIVSDFLALRAINKRFFEPLDDPFYVLVKRLFGAVIVDKVLDNIAGEFVNAGVYGVGFVDDFALKNVFALFIHLTILFSQGNRKGKTIQIHRMASSQRLMLALPDV